MSAGDASASSEHSRRSLLVRTSPTAAGQARAFVVDTLHAWQVGVDACDDGELVVSELVTNAFLHGRAPEVDVTVEDRGAHVHLAVTHREATRDDGPLAPLTVGADDTHGRGLAIVDVLSRAWGVEEDGQDRRVWADLAAGRADLPTAADRDAAIGELAADLAVPAELVGVAEVVARWARARLAVSFAGITLLDDDEPDQLRFLAASPPLATPSEVRFPVTAGRPAAAAHRDGRPYFHESRSAVVARFPDMGPALATAGLAALADLPLFDRGRPIGTLALAWSHGRVLDAGDRSWLTAVAEVTAVALTRVGTGGRARSEG